MGFPLSLGVCVGGVMGWYLQRDRFENALLGGRPFGSGEMPLIVLPTEFLQLL